MSDSAGAPKLFISYRRDETPVSAAWLYEVLVERFGESSVFMDLTLKTGEDFVERITEVLGGCHILLVVMGPRWAAPDDGTGPASIRDPDDFVRLEVEVAMARPDVEVLPVLVSGAKMPHRDELPEKIQGLTRIHAKELTNQRRAADMAELVGRIEELLPPDTMVRAPVPSPPKEHALLEPKQPEARRSRRRAAAAAAVGLAAVLGVIAVAVSLLGGGQDGPGGSGVREYQVAAEVGELDARENVVMLTTGPSGREQLGRWRANRPIDYLDGEQRNYNGMDVGTNSHSQAAVVVSRCQGYPCDVYRVAPDGLRPHDLRTPGCKAVRPSMFRGRILFSRSGKSCPQPALFLTDPNGANPERITGPTRGADLDGSVAAALVGSDTIEVFDLSDLADPRRFKIVGEHSPDPPVTVDGNFIYFIDVVGASHAVARIELDADRLELKRYDPTGHQPLKASAPSFGVSSKRLYVEGRDGVMIVDDNANFATAEGAIEEE